MRRVLALAMALFLASLFASTARHDAVASSAVVRRYVPTPFPDGWFVAHATATTGAVDDSGSSFYARRGDPEHGPALAVTSVGVESGFDGLRDDHPKRVPGLVSSTLARNGPFVWVTWPDDSAQDVEHLVAGRDLDDDDVIAAARAVDAGTFPRKGVPDGLASVRAGAGSPDYVASQQRISLVDASGTKHVELDVTAGSTAVRAAQRFWVEQVARREHPNAGPRHAVLGPQSRTIVVARGDASSRELERLASSMRPTDAAGWEAFRGRVADLPVTAIFPGASTASGVVLDGFTDGTRWGVAFDTGALAAAYTTVVTADLTSSGAGSGVPASGLPEVLSGGSVSTNGGSIFAGVIPAAAASARFVPDGRSPVEAVLGPDTADGTHRYFAAWVPNVSGTVPLVVYDASGAVLLQRQKFGCNVCDD